MKPSFLVKITVVLIVLLFNQKLAIAQAQPDTIKRLGEVIVTATKNTQHDIDIPYISELLNRKQIQQYAARSTPEALMRTTGVFVQKTNHGGGSPFIRGLTGNQTLLLIDGIRLNNSTFRYGPNQYLNTIDPFSIDKIEVVKGTGSVQHGSDALGGVIQVFTRQPVFTDRTVWNGRLLSRYMTGDMEKTLRGELAYGSKNTAIGVGITFRNFGDLVGGDTTGKQSPSGYNEWAFDVKASWKLQKEMQLTIAHQQLRQLRVPVYHKVLLENFKLNEFDPQQRMLTYARLHIPTKNRLLKEIVFTGSWQKNTEGRNTQKNNSAIYRKERDEINTIGFIADIQSCITKNWTANSGIDLYADKVNSNRTDVNTTNNNTISGRGLYPNNARYYNYSVYSLHHLSLKRWQFEAGIRINAFTIRMKDSALGVVSIKPLALVGNGSVMYKLSGLSALFVSYSTGYRAPNIDDMGTLGVVDFRYETPSSGLLPEQSRNIELGYKFRSNNLSVTASLFYMHLHNIITRIKNEWQTIGGYSVYQKENTDASFIKGAEGGFDWGITKHWKVAGGMAYQYGQNLTKAEPMRRIPPLHGRLLWCYENYKWRISAEGLFAGKQSRLAQGDREDNRIAAGGTPRWAILNGYASVEVKKWNLVTSFQNILNSDYRLHGSGINGAGRSVSFTAAYAF